MNMVGNARLVKQNIKLLQVLTKQQEDVISNQQVALQGLDKAIASQGTNIDVADSIDRVEQTGCAEVTSDEESNS